MFFKKKLFIINFKYLETGKQNQEKTGNQKKDQQTKLNHKTLLICKSENLKFKKKLINFFLANFPKTL